MLKRSLSVVLVIGSTVAAQPATTRVSDEEPEEVRLHTGSAGEYAELIEDLSLQGDQLQRFQRAIDARAAALRTWTEGEDGIRLRDLREQLAAARREKQTDRIAPLREQIQPLSEAYWALRNRTRLDILDVLTPEQRQRYLATIIYRRVLTGLGDADLTDAQQLRVRELSESAARTELRDHDWSKDPFVQAARPIAERIVAELKTPATAPAR